MPEESVGTQDGQGAADHDVPFQFGHRPKVEWPHPFSMLQLAHLLALRGRLQDEPDTKDMAE